jgi:predicted transcriptional regulator
MAKQKQIPQKNDELDSLVHHIKSRLESKGIKQGWAARVGGISDGYLSQIFSGKRRPQNLTSLRRIKNAIA